MLNEQSKLPPPPLVNWSSVGRYQYRPSSSRREEATSRESRGQGSPEINGSYDPVLHGKVTIPQGWTGAMICWKLTVPVGTGAKEGEINDPWWTGAIIGQWHGSQKEGS